MLLVCVWRWVWCPTARCANKTKCGAERGNSLFLHPDASRAAQLRCGTLRIEFCAEAACTRRAVQWRRRGGDRNGGRLRGGGGGRRHGEGVPHGSAVGIAFYAVLHLLRAIKTYNGPRRVCQMKSTRLSSSPLLRCPMLRRLGQYVGVLKIKRKLTQNPAS